MKNLTLKLALVAVATFVGLSGFAQTNTGSTQWTANTTVNDYVSTAGNKVTINKTMPFWVWPSAAYNPNFDFSQIVTFALKADITNNVSSHFAWTAGVGATVTQDAAPNDFNYVTILWNATGTKTVSVTETPGVSACPGTAVTFDVDVIAIPSVTITTVASDFGLTNLIRSGCWKIAGDNTTAIPFVDNNTNEVYPYNFHLAYNIWTVDNLEASGDLLVTGGNFDPTGATAIAYDSKINGVVAGVPNKTTNPVVVTAGTNLLQPAAVDFEAKGGKITIYEFDLLGYNGRVSRNSDYMILTAVNKPLYDTYTKYITGAGKYYIVALPAPVTGPIYHISNTFAF